MRSVVDRQHVAAIWDRCGRQWKIMLWALALVLIAGFCAALFGSYLPKTTVAPGDYFFALFLLAGAGFAVGFMPLRIFDPELRENYFDDIPFAYAIRFAPLAGLIGWLAGMFLWICHLYGWTPDNFRFFIVNPFGILLTSLIIGVVALWAIILLTRKAVTLNKGR